MTTTRIVFLSSLVMMSCGHPVRLAPSPPPSASPARPAPAPPFVVIRSAATGLVLDEGPTVDVSAVVAKQPPGAYIVTRTSASAAARSTIEIPGAAGMALDDTPCGKVEGVVVGPTEGRPVYFFPWRGPRTIHGVSVDAQGRFVACLPPDRYVVSIEAEHVVSDPVTVDVGDAIGTVSVMTRARGVAEAQTTAAYRIPAGSAAALLDAIPRTVRVIGVGEPDHGSRTYLTVRAELVLAAAQSDRLSAVVLEAGNAETIPLDDYVMGEDVDVRVAVSKIGFWTWDTEEFLAFLAQLRAHNQANPTRRVRVLGCDVQFSEAAVDYLIAHRDAAGLDDVIVELIRPLRADRGKAFAGFPPETRARVYAALQTVAVRRGRGTDTVTQRVAFAALALQHRLRGAEAVEFWRTEQRELGMAELTAESAALDPTRSAIYLAHNMHVQSVRVDMIPAAGAALRQILGDRYCVIGIFVGSGSTRAWDADAAEGVLPRTLLPSPPGTFEYAIAQGAGDARAVYVRLQDLPKAVRDWLVIPRRVRDFGPVYPGPAGALRYYPILEGFDAAVVLRDVEPTTPTATGVRMAKPRP